MIDYVIIVYNEYGGFLFHKCDDGIWRLPRGYMESRIKPEDTIKKKYKEEFGLELRELKLYKVLPREVEFISKPLGEEVGSVDIYYVCNEYEGELQEAKNVSFFTHWQIYSNSTRSFEKKDIEVLETRKNEIEKEKRRAKRERDRNYYEGALSSFINNNVVLEPPCYADEITTIYDIINKQGHCKDAFQRLQYELSCINETDLQLLMDYCRKAEYYFEHICGIFAGKYGAPCVPMEEEAQKDVQRVIKACENRYPWVNPDYIERILPGICWLSNR